MSVQCVVAADVAYVVKNSFAPEGNVLSVFNDLGLSYVIIDDSQVLETDCNRIIKDPDRKSYRDLFLIFCMFS